MTKNPLINALIAEAYVATVSLVMFFGEKFAPKNDTILAPIALISLFTLSAATMGYVFLYQPLILYFSNKKTEAVNLFLKTILFFGIITVVLLLLLFSGIFK